MNNILNKIFHKLYFNFLKLKVRKLSPHSKELKWFTALAVQEFSEPLKRNYTRYVQEVSRADMAASLQCMVFLENMCRLNSFKKLLDLGSGFSSYVFRDYAKNDASINVWSVDDNPQWIEKTREYLRHHQLSDNNLVLLEEFISAEETDFDLVLLDLNFVEMRKNYIRLAVECCRPGGMIVFDDVHKPEFMFEVLQQSRYLPIKLYDLQDLTFDQFGRYALLAIKE